MEFYHLPVLLNECIEGLNIRPDGVYVDGTLGGAGHSAEILKRLRKGRLIGIDRDKEALEAARDRLRQFGGSFIPVHGNFGDLRTILEGLNIEKADGLLFDFGVSSPQLDEAERGFSYTKDAMLDMRMDREAPLTARDVVNYWPEEQLRRILREYGEERYASRIASAIVRRRELSPIETTLELAEIIRGAMPGAALREKQHPAKRSFQAIRMAVNSETEEIERLLESLPDCMSEGARVCIISFHSLEDRCVKNYFQNYAKGCTCPPEFPVCVCGKKPIFRLITKKPITASEQELKINPRARSAKLRIAERTGD
jgi:16S rRNA (cytosine1402-N4)-methyltransferase